MIAHPDATTFQILPWRPESQGVARMFCDIASPDGTPFEGDPRWVLRRQLRKRAQDMGFTFYANAEIEFFLFGSADDPQPLDQGLVLRSHAAGCRLGVPTAHDPLPRADGDLGALARTTRSRRPSTRSTCASPTR